MPLRRPTPRNIESRLTEKSRPLLVQGGKFVTGLCACDLCVLPYLICNKQQGKNHTCYRHGFFPFGDFYSHRCLNVKAYHFRVFSRDRLKLLLDENSFEEMWGNIIDRRNGW